jgi:uncharacterized protein (TIGR00159 family)
VIDLIGILDLLDVVIVGLLLWGGLVWLRRTRARLAIPALLIVAAVYMAASRLGLRLTAGILQGFFAVLVVVLVVVFQEDLRRLFEQISAWGLRRRPSAPPAATSEAIARAVIRMAGAHTGALLVFPGHEPLERHIEGGISLRGRISEPLLLSLFDPSSPGHDGALLVVGNLVERFAVHLPLSTNTEALGEGGTRHAAALGLAERTDALCVVVSEERGTVSIARDGQLRRLAQREAVQREIQRFVDELRPPQAVMSRWSGLRRSWREGAAGLATAVVLWGLLVPGATVVEVERTATVRVENLPAGWIVDAVDPGEVQLTVRARRRDLMLADRAAFRVQLDALLVQLGRRTFEIEPHTVDSPPGVEVLAVTPAKVRLQVHEAGAPADASSEAEPPEG